MNHSSQMLHALDERIESRTQAIRADRDWWPCRRGCDQCCRQLAHPPEMSAAEWNRVDGAIATLDASTRLEVDQKINALLAQIAENTLAPQVTCPYLDEREGACRIYEARPIACRTYGFFVARDHDQYCNLIEAEVAARGDHAIVWGSAGAIQNEISQISGTPIAFDVHYRA